MLALLLLAVALGLSNFAAAIGIGVSGVRGRDRVRIAVVFGVFEAGMPILGVALGQGLASSLGQAARWLGGAALIAIGVTSLILARRDRGDRRGPDGDGGLGSGPSWRTGRVVASGLALSVDNLAAGFALGAYPHRAGGGRGGVRRGERGHVAGGPGTGRHARRPRG